MVRAKPGLSCSRKLSNIMSLQVLVSPFVLIFGLYFNRQPQRSKEAEQVDMNLGLTFLSCQSLRPPWNIILTTSSFSGFRQHTLSQPCVGLYFHVSIHPSRLRLREENTSMKQLLKITYCARDFNIHSFTLLIQIEPSRISQIINKSGHANVSHVFFFGRGPSQQTN